MDFVIENNILKGATRPATINRKSGHVILDALNKNLDHIGQIDADTGKQTTCGETKDRSVRCALWMKKFGIRPGDIVVAVTHNHLDSCVPVFATFFVDAVFNAWNHNVTLHSARRYMKKFSPKVIFTCEKAVDVLVEAASLENVNVQLVVFGQHPSARSLNEILNSQTKEEVDDFVVVDARSREDVGAIMMSSGTTGFPKGVMLSDKTTRALAGLFDSPIKNLNYLWYSTLDWISCITFILRTLLQKHTRIISNKIDVDSFFQITEKYKVHFVFPPPILVNYIAKNDMAKSYDLRSLKTFIVGGCKHNRQVLETLQRRIPTAFINNGYGATELGGGLTFKTPESKHIDSIGTVAPNCQIQFVDLTSDRALGPNQHGEIYAKSPNVMIGYYDDPEATRQAFNDAGWYRTGDIGYYNDEGEIFIVGRLKEIVKYRNYQISPAEIEEVLLSHPDVREAAVVATPHELDGDWPVAFVKKSSGSQLTEDELMEHTSVLEDYKKLRGGIYFLDSLPRTGSGKIAKNELKELAQKLIIDKK